jgi:hypothetical protein
VRCAPLLRNSGSSSLLCKGKTFTISYQKIYNKGQRGNILCRKMTDKYINAFVDLALQAKHRALDLSIQARNHAVQINDRVSESTKGRVTGPGVLAGLHVVSTVVGALSLLTYLVPTFYHKLTHRPQHLVRKYGAKWALVTGGSSGIVSCFSSRVCMTLTVSSTGVGLGRKVSRSIRVSFATNPIKQISPARRQCRYCCLSGFGF